MHRRAAVLITVLIMAFSLLAGCASSADDDAADAKAALPISKTYFIFDTVVGVRVYDSRVTEAHFDAIEEMLHRIDKEMNRQLEGSEIDAVNRQAGKDAVSVSEETFRIVSKALAYAEASGGKFDPTIGPLVELWGIGEEDAHVPSRAEIDEALAKVGYEHVTLYENGLSIRLEQDGMALDLGAIAKGYAGDVIAEYLRSEGFESALIDLGGNILAMGAKPDGSPWIIGIQDPGENRGSHIGTIRAIDKTIVTSGVYERYFVENGRAYHHILDPDTGYPTDNGLLSVTIVTDESADADALSTSVFALGLEEGMKTIEKRGDAEAIFITQDREVYVTSGLDGLFRLTDDAYTLATSD